MFSIDDLGITNEELQDKVVAAIVSAILFDKEEVYDSETNSYSMERSKTAFANNVKSKLAKRLEDAASEIIGSVNAIELEKAIRDFQIYETDGYGNKTQKTMPFSAYIGEKSKSYLLERVDAQGKVQTGYGSDRYETRVNALITNLFKKQVEEAIAKHMAEVKETLSAALSVEIGKMVGEFFKRK